MRGQIKRRVFEIISKAEEGDKVSRTFDITILSLILLSVFSFFFESYDTLQTEYQVVFFTF